MSDRGQEETGGGRPLLFPIARPAALAFLLRLPLVPERKPVIVPSLDLALLPFRVVEQPV